MSAQSSSLQYPVGVVAIRRDWAVAAAASPVVLVPVVTLVDRTL
ncbi:hypothetical protein ACFR97_00670 [Haloplanus litoreus]|uniref:Uncharacterized protein n=1 Tax=Haloplanus litoreus TaxID=767515 RepID=A0ABD5ZVG1_9EURY